MCHVLPCSCAGSYFASATQRACLQAVGDALELKVLQRRLLRMKSETNHLKSVAQALENRLNGRETSKAQAKPAAETPAEATVRRQRLISTGEATGTKLLAGHLQPTPMRRQRHFNPPPAERVDGL